MSIIARPAPSAVICLLWWLAWALTNNGWIGAILGLRLRAGEPWSKLLLLFLLFIVWLILAVRNLWVWRHRRRRAQVHANLLCLGLTALLVFALPSKAVTMFYLWHGDFQNIAQNAQTEPSQALFQEHWKCSTLSANIVPDNGVTLHFDCGIGVASLLYNPHAQLVKREVTELCGLNPEREGGLIRRLEPNWFLCYCMTK